MARTPSYLELQCRWLNHSPTRPECDRHFSAYYQALAKQLLPFLVGKLSDGRKHQAQDLFQEIMIYHVRISAEERPQAAETVRERASALAPSTADRVFARRVQEWGGKLAEWTDGAIGFCACRWPGSEPPECERIAKGINESLEPLRAGGEALTKQHQGGDTASAPSGGSLAVNNDETVPDCESSVDIDAPTDFAAEMRTLLTLSSKVRIPLIQLLYLKAKHLIVDDLRTSKPNREISLNTLDGDGDDNAPPFDEALEDRSEEHARSEWMSREEIDVLLRAPLEKTEAALDSARTDKESTRAERRLAKERDRYEFNSEVVRLSHEGYTEEEIAGQLHKTRDKVRYRKRDIYDLLADGCKTAFAHHRRRQRLSKLLSGLAAAAARLEEPPAATSPHSLEHCRLLEEVDALLAASVREAEGRLQASKHKKRRMEDQWIEHCVAKRKVRFVESNVDRAQRKEYLESIEADDVAPEALGFRLGVKPDTVMKYRQNIQEAERKIQSEAVELAEQRGRRDCNAPKIRSLLELLLAEENSIDAISSTLGLPFEDVRNLDEQIRILLQS